MSFELQYEEMPGYLAARFFGDWTAEAVWLQYESIAEQCKLTSNRKLLLDFT